MNIRLKIFYTWIVCLFLLSTGCNKYLDAKPDKSLVTPSTLTDLQSILDNYLYINQMDPGAGLASSDDYYLTQTDYDALGNDYNKHLYIWNPDNLFEPGINEWSKAYDNVYRANVVLDNISSIAETQDNQDDWNNIKGQALFLRAKSFFQIATIWINAYDSSGSATDLGIPLRLNSDFNEVSVRSTAEETYHQIITDLKTASGLLPVTPVHVMRSSKPAAYALLARVYLSMRKYDSCFKYVNASLQLKSVLVDYNSLSATTSYPFTKFNDEVLLAAQVSLPAIMPTIYQADSLLYSLYNTNDLRKVLFFKSKGNSQYAFKGSYTKSIYPFSGIATDEVYLMRAECYARMGQLQPAMDDLNTLLSKRWKTGTYTPVTGLTKDTLLSFILQERRKELAFRDLRWMDIKRLNKEGAGIVLKRNVNGTVYTLSPNDLRYALAIPEDVITLSGMQQNPR